MSKENRSFWYYLTSYVTKVTVTIYSSGYFYQK